MYVVIGYIKDRILSKKQSFRGRWPEAMMTLYSKTHQAAQ
jgi:hypothetical protein